MNIEEIRTYVLNKKGVTEALPFGNETLVFKTMNKIFMLVGLESNPLQFNVKCDPEIAIELRERYPNTVLPGYHMNKKHWNTIIINDGLSSKQLKEMINHSYELIATSLPKKLQEELKN